MAEPRKEEDGHRADRKHVVLSSNQERPHRIRWFRRGLSGIPDISLKGEGSLFIFSISDFLKIHAVIVFPCRVYA